MSHQLPNNIKLGGFLPHGIFAAGGAFVPTQEKKKKKKLGGFSIHTRKKKRDLRNYEISEK